MSLHHLVGAMPSQFLAVDILLRQRRQAISGRIERYKHKCICVGAAGQAEAQLSGAVFVVRQRLDQLNKATPNLGIRNLDK